MIDDSQYLLVNELFDRANERGYDKKPRLDIIEVYLNKSPDGYSLKSINHIEGAFGGQIFPSQPRNYRK